MGFFVALFTFFLFGFALRFPILSGEWIREGYLQVIQGILPSLFLPMILTNFMFLSPLREHLQRIFRVPCRLLFGLDSTQGSVLLFGLLCGYPTGIILARELERSQRIQAKEYRSLCLVANNCGAGFLFHFLGSRIGFQSALILFLSQLLSCVLLCRLFCSPIQATEDPSRKKSYALSFVAAVKQSTVSLAYVSGFVIFFSFLGHLSELTLGHLFPQASLLSPTVYSLMELSGGLAALTLKDAPLALTAFLIGWGGICVWAQSKMAADGPSLPTGYLPMRLLHGALCALFCSLFSFFLL